MLLVPQRKFILNSKRQRVFSIIKDCRTLVAFPSLIDCFTFMSVYQIKPNKYLRLLYIDILCLYSIEKSWHFHILKPCLINFNEVALFIFTFLFSSFTKNSDNFGFPLSQRICHKVNNIPLVLQLDAPWQQYLTI